MGKLNIAHHKSYHPYRRDNVERVRRDEEKAKLEEEGKKGEVRRLDSEARLESLRRRASAMSKASSRGPSDSEKALERQLAGKEKEDSSRVTIIRPDGWKDKKGKARMGEDNDEGEEPARGQQLIESSKNVQSITDANGHVNFWADFEQGRATASMVQKPTKSKEEQDFDDQITMYLVGKPGVKPSQGWYHGEEQSPSQGQDKNENRINGDARTKSNLDPLRLMNAYSAERSRIIEKQEVRRLHHLKRPWDETPTTLRGDASDDDDEESDFGERRHGRYKQREVKVSMLMDKEEWKRERTRRWRKRHGEDDEEEEENDERSHEKTDLSSMPPPPPPASSSKPRSISPQRVSVLRTDANSERARARAMIASKRKEKELKDRSASWSTDGNSTVDNTPRSEFGYSTGMYNRKETQMARNGGDVEPWRRRRW